MRKPKEINICDLPSTAMVPDGYDMRSVPEATKENLEYIISEHNNLVVAVNHIIDHLRITIDEEGA